MLDLGDADAGFAGVDLPSTPPLEPPASGVSFKAKPGSQPGSGSSRSLPSGEVALDIEDVKPKRNKRSSGKTAKAEAAPPRRRSPILLVSLLLVAGAGAGGFYFFRTWKAKQDRAAIAKTSLDRARAELVAGRWNTAGAAAQEAIDHGAEPGEAYGIAAQASYAGALDEGTRIEPRFKTGSRLVNKARELTLSGPDIAKADGLKALADGKAQLAVDRLGKMPPNDHNGQLYQGWARHAAGDHQGAIDAFERSIKANPKRDLPALYGRARARLALGDREAAKADFALVLERVKDHLGAQLGLAIAAATPTELAGREQALLALLGHKDIDKADQRLVAEAWTVAGDDASHASRTDAARDHYRKALQKDPLLIAPLRGLAVLEMREGKLDAAADVLAKAQKIAPDDVALGLVDAELALRTKNLVDAEGKLHALRERKPPITDPAAKARLFLLTAELHLAKAAHDDALAACEDALATAAPEDIEVPLAAASMLGQIADKAPDNAAKLRERADEILEPLAVRGKKDAQVALSLGVGYLAAGNPEKAETWLRQVIAARPQDIDAHFQLAEALSRQGKRDEALAILRKAYELEPTRTDVGVQLARRYEEAGRYEDATAMYDRLLAGTEVTVDMRGRAGRFFARRGKPDKARAQGEEILSADPRNAAGLFLRGFGLLADGKAEEAKRRLQEAVDLDPDPQYLEALGLALELMYNDSKEERFRDDAIRIYGEAVQADPRALAALSGQGRMLIARRDGEKAVVPLLAANKLWPDNADLEFNIGIAYQLAEKPKEAIEWQARSLKKKRRAEAFLNVGTMYYEQTNYRQAAVFLFEATVEAEKAIKAGAPAPEWLTGAYYRLGDAHSNLRHNAAACRAWRKYLDTNPTDTVKADGIKRELLRVCD
jgi:tetratricopeptide (TPR) repeat protein